ncbi:S8 family serine peptidase [Lentzea sp. NPDC006480]|uniref:S8 family serine peptidase n=1 Tax=Lentzea sp. NPDC006480 TaxID=3157176 RepID=UPI0033AD6756
MTRRFRRAAAIPLTITLVCGGLSPAHAQPGEDVTVFVEVDGTPGVEAFDSTRSLGRDAGVAKQAALRAEKQSNSTIDAVLSGLRVEEIGRTHNAVPGVQLRTSRPTAAALAKRPGVKSVEEVRALALPTNSDEVQWTKVLDAWRPPHGRHGEDIRIAVIDTGFDYTHADFGGPGTKEAYEAVDRTKADPAFPTAKVVGGWDFSGDVKDETKQDPNPLSCDDYGPDDVNDDSRFDAHGTHVAGIAAGFGVDADGKTFTGDYDQLTAEQLGAMKIGPGAAPKALLYLYKVFPCNGAKMVTPVKLAVDRALDPDEDGDFSDRVDVINLSLGSSYGNPDDSDVRLVREVTKHGVVVVSSAGNEGDHYDITGGYGTGTEAISVANGDLRSKAPAHTASTSSSRGWRGPVLKPDLTAPGNLVVSADSGTGTGSRALSGTSQAAPHVAGMAALVRQEHPDWTPQEVKAALMNTANTDLAGSAGTADGKVLSPVRVGSGLVDAEAALETKVLAFNAADPAAAGVTFETVEVAGSTTLRKQIKLVNKGVQPTRVTASYLPAGDLPGVRFSVSPSEVRLTPRGTAQVEVTLEIDDPGALRKVRDPGKDSADDKEQFLAEASGRVVFTPADPAGPALRVPVYAAPKPVAAMRTGSTVLFGAGAHEESVRVSGTGLDQGEGVERYQSRLSVFSNTIWSDRLPDCSAEVTQGCVKAPSARPGDLRFVGVTSTAPEDPNGGIHSTAVVAFGIVTYENWRNIGTNIVPRLEIDRNNDQQADFTYNLLYEEGTDVLTLQRKTRFGWYESVSPANSVYGTVDTNVFDTNVIVLVVPLKELSIFPGFSRSGRISYRVSMQGEHGMPETWMNGEWQIDGMTEWASFDVLKPGLWVDGPEGAALAHPVREGTRFTIHRDENAARVDGLLVIHHHNATGNRAQEVEVIAPPAQP